MNEEEIILAISAVVMGLGCILLFVVMEGLGLL